MRGEWGGVGVGGVGGREREKERERERETDRQTDRQTDRPTERESHHLYTCTNTLLYISPLCIIPSLDAGSIHL